MSMANFQQDLINLFDAVNCAYQYAKTQGDEQLFGILAELHAGLLQVSKDMGLNLKANNPIVKQGLGRWLQGPEESQRQLLAQLAQKVGVFCQACSKIAAPAESSVNVNRP